jgi:hypothetical protein
VELNDATCILGVLGIENDESTCTYNVAYEPRVCAVHNRYISHVNVVDAVPSKADSGASASDLTTRFADHRGSDH